MRLIEGNNIVNLGKYGSFDARTQLFGQPYGVTLEVVSPPSAAASPAADSQLDDQQQDTLEKQDSKDVAVDSKKRDINGMVKQDNNKDEKAQIQPLCTLRPYQELSLEDIEVDEATNENILASGAKVRLMQCMYLTI